MGRDTFDVAALLLRRIRGGLGMATVAANAVFAACTGTTIASASVFTKVATPEMVRHGYTRRFSVGVVAVRLGTYGELLAAVVHRNACRFSTSSSSSISRQSPANPGATTASCLTPNFVEPPSGLSG
jgi:hypothetical protein